MPALSLLLQPEHVIDIDSGDRDEVLRALVSVVAREAGVDADALLRAVREREALCSTGFGEGLAMPHVRFPGLRSHHVVLGRTRPGIPFEALDGQPVHLLLLVAGPAESKEQYQKLMGAAARFLKAEHQHLREGEDLVAAVAERLTEH